jgi:hypothetical protein
VALVQSCSSNFTMVSLSIFIINFVDYLIGL